MEFYRLLPEIFILCATCIILLVDLYTKQDRLRLTYYLAQLSVIVALVLSCLQLNISHFVGFHGNFIRDQLTTLLEIGIYASTFVVFLFSRDYILDRGNMARGEYYVLGLLSMLGMMVLVSSHSLLALYLGLELLSLPLYAMVAMHRDDKRATEGAMKYFVMGALASGMLLYGMSLVYGMTGSIDISTIAKHIVAAHEQHSTGLILGVVFLVIGIAFKLGAAPFHMWVPDVYEGAPTSVTLFVGTAPKLAAFGMAIRLLVEMLPALHAQWEPLLILLAILSMAIGNFLAIAQTSLKRMLAYSGIAHVGYMSLGLIAGARATSLGLTDVSMTSDANALFYMIIYVIMSLASFSILIILSRQGFECEKISDLQGLNSRSPWLALMMLLVMFSMAGIPPLVGFFAKLGVLVSLIDVHLVWLAVVAIIFAIIGLYYYLRVVKVMYFDRPVESQSIAWSPSMLSVFTINSMALLFLGIFPGALFAICRQVFMGV